MLGFCLDCRIHGILLYFFLYPVFFAFFFSWPIWPVTFAYLVYHSPNKQRFKWWLFMPIGSLAAGIVGALKAGLILWLPTLFFYGFHFPDVDKFSLGMVFYFVSGGAAAVLFSTRWVLWLDQELHREERQEMMIK